MVSGGRASGSLEKAWPLSRLTLVGIPVILLAPLTMRWIARLERYGARS
jgi:hypothetical protein